MDKAEITQIQQAKKQPSLSRAMLYSLTRRMSFLLLATVVLLSVAISVVDSHIAESKYKLDRSSQKMAGESYAKLKTELKYDKQTGNLQYKPELQNSQTPDPSKVSNKEGQYSVTIKGDPKQGIAYYDPDSTQSFTIKPNFDVSAPRVVEDHVVIPATNSATQQVFTFKSNGLKEDIILSIPQGDSLSFSYTLDLPASLEARMMQSGEVGIYTGTDQGLFGSQISYGSDKDKQLVEKAQAKAKKDKLVFVLPAPVIKQSNNKMVGTDSQAIFKLDKNILTVQAKGLSKLHYPISIDPSTIVSSVSSLGQGNDLGESNYDSSTGRISRTPISGGKVTTNIAVQVYPINVSLPALFAFNGVLYSAGGCTAITTHCTTATASVYTATVNSDGSLGSWSNTASDNLPAALYGGQATVYNGYVYFSGGLGTGSPPTTSSTIYYSKIDSSSGRIKGWTATSSLLTARAFHAIVANNGYLYVLGGCTALSSFGTCGSSTNATPLIEYVAIKADGSLNSWADMGMSYSSFVWALIQPVAFKAQVYGGKIYFRMVSANYYYETYIFGVNESNGTFTTIYDSGITGVVATNPSLFGIVNGYAFTGDGSHAIDSDGVISLGIADSSTLALTPALLYRGYFYFVGGLTTTTPGNYNIVYSTGTVGATGVSTEVTSSLTNGRQRLNVCTAAYGGFVYLVGGDESGPTYTNNVLSAQLYAEGGIGSWTTQANTFTTGRYLHSCQAYGGYMYVIAGNDGTNDLSDIQYATIQNGTVGTFATATAKLPAARAGLSTAIYKNGNGNVYLYAIGGCTTSAAACSTGSTPQQQIYYGTLNTSTGNICGDNAGSWDCAGAAGSRNMRTATANTNQALYTALHSFSAVVYNGKLYILGGMTAATTRVNTVKYIDISSTSSDGDISSFGSWNTANSMTQIGASGKALFTATIWNGYIYAPGGVTGATAGGTASSANEYAKINSDGSLGTWTAGTSLPANWSRYGSVAYQGKVYVISGSRAGTRSRNFVQITVNNGGGGGANSAETAQNALPNARFLHGAVAYNGYLYVAGGYVCADANNPCSTTTSASTSVLYAPLDSAGYVGTWTATQSLISNRVYHKLLAYNGTIYAIAGCALVDCSTRVNSTERATINSDGTLGSWQTTNSPNTTRGGFAAFQYNGYVYVLGGCNTTTVSTACATALNSVEYAQIQSNGSLSTWSTTSSFTTSRWLNFAVNNAGYAYVGGGVDSAGGVLYDVQYATINSDGTLGSWTTEYHTMDKSIITGFGYGGAFVNNGFIYAVSNAGDVISAPLSNTGSLNGPWNLSSNRCSVSGGASFGGLVWYNGNVYTTGGAYIFNIYKSVGSFKLYNSPRVGVWSRAIDTDVDTTPNKIYFSGSNTNNPGVAGSAGLGGINISYRSVSQDTNIVGSSTAINPGRSSILGNLLGYTAYNNSGVAMGTARLYSIRVTIDETYSSSFPDGNLSSGDYFSGYTFWYHPGSGKRLRGGQTFTGEQIQSLDTTPN